MSESIPPFEPSQEPPKPLPTGNTPGGAPPSKGLCTFLGFLLFLVSGGLAFAFPPICLVGFVVAVGSLFFEGYRCIFVGYILTIGLLLLVAIIYCANYPMRFD
jgi:hypothetical protein